MEATFQKQYETATTQVALVVNLKRGFFDVKGVDARKFLNGVLTNDIGKLEGKNGCTALICTPKGKILADLFVYTCGEFFCFEVDASLKEKTLEILKKYIIFQKVELVDQSEKFETAAILGPKAKEFLSSKGIPTPEAEFGYDEGKCEEREIWVIHKKLWGLPAYEIWLRRDETLDWQLPALSLKTQEILRIESATPKYGVDMDENTIPQEAGLYHALSFTKGCYVGQEVIARLEHRGHVGKKLLQLKMEGEFLPPPGEKIFANTGQEAGTVTSSCFSPQYNAPVALGYIRYVFLGFKEFRIGETRAQVLDKITLEKL